MRLLSALLSFTLLLFGVGAVVIILIFDHYSKNLPDYSYLKDYQPKTLSRIYADDGRMLATIAAEQRVFVPINVVPRRVVNAFLAAEDEDFFNHSGIDYVGIVRAALTNVHNIGRDRRPVGASTITQQVAKNMLLGNEVSIARKVREAILATRLEKALTKDRILEIYLNEIFLGNRSYGIGAAALNYFNKSLDELTIAQAAYLAGLPKAPNSYHPVKNREAAYGRRDYVIGRMENNGFITSQEADLARQEPLEMHSRDEADTVDADYFSEEVRRQLVAQFGDTMVTEGGLAVKTSLDTKLQNLATKALRNGLISFDRRERGWRGPVTHFDSFSDWQKNLKAVVPPAGGEDWQLAIVGGVKDKEAQIAFMDNRRGSIPWNEMSWARRELGDHKYGPAIRKVQDVLKVGDVIMVEPVQKSDDGKAYPENTYTLRQVPIVQGAIVALDPHTGRVYAMSGGFSAKISQFNRATQAQRQPGSAFKPFVYMAALDKGFTPASLIMDAEFEYVQGPGLPLWRPENYSQEFYGATPLRVGVEKSRNVMTVRLANAIGMPTVVEYAKKFGIVDEMPELLSFSLGAKETTPLRLVTGYGMIVNGGKKITPTLVDRVQDRNGRTIWRADQRLCVGCQDLGWSTDTAPPDIPDTRAQIEDPRTTYQMVSILEGVVQRGTAVKLKDIGVPLAGKTGTTNESKDAWFVGFTPDLVAGVFVGFDGPEPLGSHETGASVAVPIFKDFIAEAMKGKPAIPFRVPPGLRMVRVNPETEELASIGEKNAIWESFIPGTEPQEGQTRPILDGSVTGEASEGAAAAYSASSSSSNSSSDSVTVFDSGPEYPGQPPLRTHVEPVVTSPSTAGTGGLY